MVSVINIAGEIEKPYIEELKKNEFSVQSVAKSDAESAIEETDIIIIYNDVQENMGDVCRLILKIREKVTASLWVFSKQNSDMDRLLYLQLGVNHTIDKECAPEELQLIVKNEVKKNLLNDIEQEKKYEMDYHLDVKNQTIFNDGGTEVELTKLEYQLVSILSKALGEAVSYNDIYMQLWEENPKYARARVANLVFHLRRKLQENGLLTINIKTVRSRGYRLTGF